MENRTSNKAAKAAKGGRGRPAVARKKKPKFNVPNLGFFKSVKARWRKPRGTHNKKRMKFKWAGALPCIGYRNPHEVRGMHPAGMREVLVHNVPELEGLAGVVLRIASGVGARKRKMIEDKANAMNLRILNPKADGKAKEGEAKGGKAREGKGDSKFTPNSGIAKAKTAVHAVQPTSTQSASAQAKKAAPPKAPDSPSPPGVRK
jgi:ribosomal protein L32E